MIDNTEEAAADATETEEVASAEETSEETVEAEEDSDDEDFEPMRFGFHAGLASNLSVISTRGNATLDLGLGFAYFFTPNIGVVTGADLGIGYAQYKIPGYLYAYGYYESNVRSVVFSVDVPVKVRYAINSDFWVEAGTGLYVSVYGYTHSSNDFNSQDTYSSTISAGVRNYTIGGGMNLGSIGLGAEVGYVSGGWSLGVNLYTGL